MVVQSFQREGQAYLIINLAVIMWSMWRERNARLFESKAKSIQSVFEEAKNLLIFWFLSRKEFRGSVFDDFIGGWQACLKGIGKKSRPKERWKRPDVVCLKFNVDGATKGKPRSAGIGGVLLNHRSEILYFSTEPIGIKDSNEAELVAIKKALH